MACAKCGCVDTRDLGLRKRDGRAVRALACDHCGVVREEVLNGDGKKTKGAGVAGCPRCGCRHGDEVRVVKGWFGSSKSVRRCRHCGREYLVDDVDAVDKVDRPRARKEIVREVVERPVCPKCGGARTKVRSTLGTRRYRRCEECGERFVSESTK